MRRRLAAVLVAAAAASVTGVVSAPAAQACAPEDCPLLCRVLETVTGVPPCDSIEWNVEGGAVRA